MSIYVPETILFTIILVVVLLCMFAKLLLNFSFPFLLQGHKRTGGTSIPVWIDWLLLCLASAAAAIHGKTCFISPWAVFLVGGLSFCLSYLWIFAALGFVARESPRRKKGDHSTNEHE